MQTNLDYDDLDDSYFASISEILLNECYLLVNKNKYRLVEIEFYLKCNSHDDPYTHCDPDQLLMHTFYFHKFGNGTYKAGTFKGMDLTFGNKKENAYFGILIRSIQNINTGVIIQGPCNTVNKILEEYHCDSILNFTNGKNLNIFDNDKKFILVPTSKLEKRQISHGPRIGLSAKYPEYHKRNYRFVTNKKNIIKNKSTLIDV